MSNSIIASGHQLIGCAVSEHKYQATTSVNQVEAYGLRRPSEAANATQKQAKADYKLQAANDLHDQVNRRFTKKRIDRATAYSGYIERVECHGGDGGTPAVTIFCPQHLSVDENSGNLVIPYGTTLVVIDGETQTEARFMLRERNMVTGDHQFAITVYHGISFENARQILHDYNAYAMPIGEISAAAFNNVGPLSKAVDHAIELSNFSEDKINHLGRTGNKKHVVSYQQLLTAAAGYALSGAGLSSSISDRVIKGMNGPESKGLPEEASKEIADMISLAGVNDNVRKSAPIIWQVAGAVVSQGRGAASLNWTGAIQAYNDSRSAGQGGRRMSTKERLQFIANAI